MKWKLFKSKNKYQAINQNIQMENINQSGPLKKTLKDNIKQVKEALGESSDIVTREFLIGEDGKIKLGLFYIEGLANTTFIQDIILKTLMIDIRKANLNTTAYSKKKAFEILRDFVLSVGNMKEIADFENLLTSLLSGDAIVLIDGYEQGFAIDSKGWEERGVTEPTSQTVVRGPKDSFSETLRTNISLIRRRIKDPSLWIETKQIGRRTKTDVAIVYIKGVASDKIVKEVRRRLDKIDIDGILESSYIEELIQDETYSFFPTVYNTERPDSVAAGLLEGRVAILVDGTPFVLLVPTLFVQYFQSSEDYYQRSDIGSLLRILRYLSFFIALLTPSLYIAVTTFHQEMLPTPLLISIAAQREGTPFPAFVEALMMEITFEILREAGIRMPRAVGPAISIVGALVLGEAAVKAGIVSPVMVIVVSITAISSFVSPTYNMAIAVRILRFLFMTLAATFGLFGIALGLIAMVLHLCSLRSFGIPYMAPMAPFIWNDQKDVIVRSPIWNMFSRPRLINQKNIIRQQSPSMAKPKPPQKKTISIGRRSFPMKGKVTLLITLTILVISLTGCWNRRELTDLSIATAMGIDKSDDGYLVTAQIINPSEIAAQVPTTRTAVTSYRTTGATVFEALRKLTKESPRKIYMSHMRTIVFGEDLAKEGIAKTLDFISRDHEFRTDFYILVARGVKATEVLNILTPLEKIPANKIYYSLRMSEKAWAATHAVQLDELISKLVSKGDNPVLTGILIKGDPEKGKKLSNVEQVKPSTLLEIDSLAAFKKDKLVGWLVG